MFFKTWKSAIQMAAVMASSALFSCDLKIGEEPPPQNLGQLSGTGCISGATKSFQKFIVGEAQDSEVASSFDCLNQVIEKFSKYVRGRDETKFDIKELAEFAEIYFIEKNSNGQPVNNVSEGLQTELMRMKQLFFGGSLQYVTRPELKDILGVLSKIKVMAIQMNPYMKVYTLNWKISNDRTEDSKYFEAANEQLQVFAKELSALVISDHKPYEFKDFIELLNHTSTFYNEKWNFIGQINHYLPLIYKVKKIIAGGEEDSIKPGEWKSFLLLGARSYIQYNRYFYFLGKSADTTTSISLGYITRELEDLFSIFEDSIRDKPYRGNPILNRSSKVGFISRAELDELLIALSQVWPEFKISNALVDEVMIVKQVLFGGDVDRWSASDFANAKNKIVQLKPLLENFFPYYSIYSLEWNPAVYDDQKAQTYFKQAQDSLSIVMAQLGTILEAPYSLGHLYKLVNEFEKVYPTQVDSTSFDSTLKTYLPLFQNIKNMLFEDQGDEILKSQWPEFLSYNSDLYSFYLNYHYFVRGQSLKEPMALFAMRFLVESTIEDIEKLIKIKPSHVISERELLALALELQKIDVIPVGIKKDTLNKVISATLHSLLNPPSRRLNGEKPNHFDRVHLNELHNETFIWIETEFFLRNIFLIQNNEITLSPFDLNQKIEDRLADPTISVTLKLGLTELKRVLSSQVPLVIDSEKRLAISGRLIPEFTSDSVSRMNATRAVARLLVRSYGNPPKASAGDYERLSKPEAIQAFTDFKGIASDLKYLAPDNKTFVDSRFLEANIFGPRGNGDNFLSFLELSDILNMILSGTKLDSMMRPSLLTSCLPKDTVPENSTAVDYDCVYKSFSSEFPVNFTSVPDFLNFLKANDSCENEIAFFNLIKAAGYKPNAKKKIKLEDISLIPHVVQYLEMTFSRFDANHDQKLDRFEAEKAFPVFQPLFKDLAKDYIKKGLLSEKDLFPLFTFVLKNGKIPDGLGDFVKFYIWKKTAPHNRIFFSDRNKLASILGVVADESSKSDPKASVAPTAEILEDHFSKKCQPQTNVSDTTVPGYSPILGRPIGR